MDLRAFPFDEDSIDFRFVGSRFRSGETATEKELILKCRSTEFVRCYFSRHLHEYEIQGVSYINYCARGFSYIVWGISLRRMFSYYFYKVTLLMWLIAGISMQVFLFSTEELEQRQELAAAMMDSRDPARRNEISSKQGDINSEVDELRLADAPR